MNNIPEEIREYLVYDKTSPSGLTWIKRPARCISIGDQVGSLSGGRYYRFIFKGIHYSVHRVVWYLCSGEDPGDLFIDHIDGDKRNNLYENLRLATLTENNRNVGIRKANKTGVKGVRFKSGKYEASVSVNNKSMYLGRFSDLESARLVIEAARNKYHGEFSNNE